jgi:hypothetical protein
MPLFKTIPEMKAVFSRLNASASIESYISFRDDAEEKYIKPLIGELQFEDLQIHYDSNAEDLDMDNLLYQVRRCLVYYTLLEAAPTQLLDFGDGGIMEGQTEGQSSARQWTMKGATDYFSANADTFAESVLQFLEKNKENFPTWNNSDFRKNARSLFISSGKMWMESGADICQPHRFFLNRINSIKRVEDINIQDIIGSGLLLDLKIEMREGTLTSEYELLIEKIKPVVAYYALADSLPHASYSITSSGIRLLNANDGIKNSQVVSSDLIAARTQDSILLGNRYEAILRKFLNDNAADYPLWPVPTTSTGAGAVKSLIDNGNKKSFQL